MPALGTGDDLCSRNPVCKTSPDTVPPATPSTSGDRNPSHNIDVYSAWAGIVVVIVVVMIALGVWYTVSRKKRKGKDTGTGSRGGDKPFRSLFGRRLGGFRRKPTAAQPQEQPIAIVETEIELEQNKDPEAQRRNSSASSLKRPTTSETVETDATHVSQHDASLKEGDQAGISMSMSQQQSARATTPTPGSDTPKTRPLTPVSIRSSLSKLDVPPPGLGPPTQNNI